MICFHEKQFELEQVISSSLIQPAVGMHQIYQHLVTYSKLGSTVSIDKATIYDLQEPLRSLLLAHQECITTMAIDLPVFLKSTNPNAKTLMVCAMDPLPPLPTSDFWHTKKVNFREDIGFWAPFSLIDNWDRPFGSMKTNLPFFKTLLTEYHLYVTDIFKLFFRFEQGGYQSSNAIPAYTELRNASGSSFHGEILAQEIALVDPMAIVTLGNASRNKLLDLANPNFGRSQLPKKWGNDIQRYFWNDSIPIVASPHISGAANGAKSALLSNKRYQSLTGNYQNERLAKILMAQL